MFFGGISERGTRAAIADAGLHLETLERIPETENGRKVEFVWITANKAS